MKDRSFEEENCNICSIASSGKDKWDALLSTHWSITTICEDPLSLSVRRLVQQSQWISAPFTSFHPDSFFFFFYWGQDVLNSRLILKANMTMELHAPPSCDITYYCHLHWTQLLCLFFSIRPRLFHSFHQQSKVRGWEKFLSFLKNLQKSLCQISCSEIHAFDFFFIQNRISKD